MARTGSSAGVHEEFAFKIMLPGKYLHLSCNLMEKYQIPTGLMPPKMQCSPLCITFTSIPLYSLSFVWLVGWLVECMAGCMDGWLGMRNS